LVEILGADFVAWATLQARKTPWGISDWAHLIIFAAFGALVWMSRPDLRGWRVVLIALAISFAMEVAQELAPSRSPQLRDVLLNLAGALFGFLIGHGLQRATTIGRSARTQSLR